MPHGKRFLSTKCVRFPGTKNPTADSGVNGRKVYNSDTGAKSFLIAFSQCLISLSPFWILKASM